MAVQMSRITACAVKKLSATSFKLAFLNYFANVVGIDRFKSWLKRHEYKDIGHLASIGQSKERANDEVISLVHLVNRRQANPHCLLHLGPRSSGRQFPARFRSQNSGIDQLIDELLNRTLNTSRVTST